MTKFWEALGGRLADRWIEVSASALLFWAAAAATWASTQHLAALRHRARDFGQEPVPLQVLAIAAGLIVVTLSAVAVGALARPVQRLAEGYWPRMFSGAHTMLIRRQTYRREFLMHQWQKLAQRRHQDNLSNHEQEEFVVLDRRLRKYPVRPQLMRPTLVGNVLAAANEEPFSRYGLDPFTVWPHLRPLLPELARAQFDAAQARRLSRSPWNFAVAIR